MHTGTKNQTGYENFQQSHNYWASLPQYNTVSIMEILTRNNTDGNKLVISFDIALYNGDNYILSSTCYIVFIYSL